MLVLHYVKEIDEFYSKLKQKQWLYNILFQSDWIKI